jgi:hypothetical protein
MGIYETQTAVIAIIKESSGRYKTNPEIPPIFLSARYWCWKARSTQADVQLERISPYDPMIFKDVAYRPEVITPPMDPGSDEWSPRWWLDTTRSSGSQSITREGQVSSVVVKVEPTTEEEVKPIKVEPKTEDVKPMKTDRQIESGVGPREGDGGKKAQDEDGQDEEGGETLDEEDAGERQPTGVRPTPGLSAKAKGKQRAMETPPPPSPTPPSTPRQSPPIAKAIQRKRKAAGPADDEPEVSKPTKRVKRATEKDIGGGSGGKQVKRPVEDDGKEEDVRPVKKARTRNAKTPVVEADNDDPASPCPRCVRLGTQCVNSPGRACKSCNKSKLKCPLYNGRRRRKAPVVSRDKSVASTLASFQYDVDHEFYIPMADVAISPSPRPRQRSKSRAKSVKASASGSGLEGGRAPTELKMPKTPAPKLKSARQSAPVVGESSRRGKSSHPDLARTS